MGKVSKKKPIHTPDKTNSLSTSETKKLCEELIFFTKVK